MTVLNRERIYEYLSPSTGEVRSTAEILKTLNCSRGAANHAIPIAKPIDCEQMKLPIPPYTLGAWLGDGSHDSGRFTSDDIAVIDSIRSDGFRVEQHNCNEQSWGIWEFKSLIRATGLLLDKHVPSMYLRASFDQRLSLMQGLMDTDGGVDIDGKAEFTSTRKVLAESVYELASSLGLKPTMREGRATLYGKDCGPKWRVGWTSTLNVFRLPRKAVRIKASIRGCQNWRYIKTVEQIPSVPTRCIAVDSPSHLYLAGRQMVPTHNTDLLVADGAQEVGNPNFRGLLLRKSFTEMNNIIDRMMAIYRPLGGHPSDGGKMWRFPSGAQLRLGYLANDGDVEKYQGSPFSWLGVDEAGNQLEKRFRAILPWLASTDPTLRVRARLTANPGGVGADWLMRLFLRDKCPVHYPDDSVEPGAIYAGQKLTWTDGRPLDPRGKMTVSFIPSRVEDNPLYGEDKIAMLQSQEGAVADKLLMGCWCELAGRYFSFLRPDMKRPWAEHPGEWWNTHLISIDYGFGESWAAAVLGYVSEPTLEWPEGRMFIIGEVVEQSMGSEDFAKHCISTFVERDGARPRTITAAYCDPANDGHTGNGRSNMEIMGEVFAERDIPIMAAYKNRVANAQNLYRMLKKGQVVVMDSCPMLFKSLNSRMHDPAKSGDIKKIKGNPLDDLYDAAVYLANTYFSGDAKPKEVRQAETIASYEAQGMDEHSIGIHRMRMMMDQQDDDAPFRMTRVGGSRVISRG